MSTFVMLTKLSPEALNRPGAVDQLNRDVEEKIRRECPNIRWVANYSILGP